MASPDAEWVTVAEAVELSGCTEGYIRRLLGRGDGRLTGWKAGERAWLVRRADCLQLRKELSTRSNLRKAERAKKATRAKRKSC